MTNLKIRLFPLFVFILGCCYNTTAQNPYIRHFTTSNGLPSNTIYQIFQDSQKFIWFTSDAGVVKFDGSNYTTYRKKDGLSSNDVVRIKEDTKGRIWIFNYNGTVNYIFNNKVYNGNNTPFLKSIIGKGFILDFFIDSKQTIHFYNWQREVFSLDINNKVTRDTIFKNTNITGDNLIINRYLSSVKVHFLSINPLTQWVIWTNIGIFRQEIPQKNKISVVDSSLFCRLVFPTKNNINYIKTYNEGLIRVSGNFSKEKISYPGDPVKINNIIEDSDGYLWIAAYDGVFCLRNKKLIKYFDIQDALGLLQDQEKNIWVSTQSDGVYMINYNLLQQHHFDCSYFEQSGVTQLSLFPGSGIWCSNTKAAFLLNKSAFIHLPAPKDILPINLLGMLKDKTLFLVSSSHKVCAFENLKFNSSSKEFGYTNRTIFPVAIKKIINDQSGYASVMFEQSQFFFAPQFKQLNSPEYSLMNERINNIFFNSDNNLVINTNRNYLYKNGKKEVFSEISRFDGSIITDHIVLDKVTELYSIDGEDLYLIRKSKILNLSNAFDTPIDVQIKKVVFADSILYLASNKEIFIATNLMKVFSGFPVHIEPLNISFNNINDILFLNDTLYVASNDGLTCIAKESFLKNKVLPPIPYSRSLIVNETKYPISELNLKLIGQNTIKLSFGCISYSSSPVIYSYKLEGADNKYTMGTGSNINLMYQNLPKGNYVFKLRVRKSNSAWSAPLLLTIIIEPTLIEYPAFWVFIVLIATGLVFLIAFRIKAQKIKKAEIDHQLVVMEQKALQSMMNPHFIFNSLGSIQNYLLKNKGSEAVIYLSQFARLIRQNLDTINAPMIALNEEIDRLGNYLDLENKRLENKFVYTIEIDKLLEEERLYIPSMIIQPIAENAIWHGLATLEEAGSIKISFRAHTNKSLKVIVEDNGIGLKKSLEYSAKSSHHQHLGMKIIKKRLLLLGKKYHTELGIQYSENYPGLKSPGAVVEIILPFVLNDTDF